MREPPEDLLAGRRALDGISRVAVLDDWAWYDGVKAWALHVRLDADVAADSGVPRLTPWYITADPDYPWGDLRFYPAKTGGITSTYHHQMNNRLLPNDLPWREGWLCLKHPTTGVAIFAPRQEEEPTGAHLKLKWHCLRALEWLRLAATEGLVADGEPFELPHFSATLPMRLAFIEDEESFREWGSVEANVGFCAVRQWPGNEHVVVVGSFSNLRSEALVAGRWQRDNGAELPAGIWIRLNGVPVVRNWEAPTVWPDLLAIEGRFGHLLSQAVPKIRDGQRRMLLVGFPVPSRIGEQPSRMHWQAAMLPALSTQPTKGFPRDIEASFWLQDKAKVLQGPVDWVRSANWAEDQLATRGRFPDGLTSRAVLLLGCGALGASVAEILVRGGVKRMVLVDGDDIEAGNLVRHTLTANEVGMNKAVALADRLNAANVHAEVKAIGVAFPPSAEEAQHSVDECDLVIDCTGSDKVLRFMETYPWGRERHFVSLSMGYAARRLFCFAATARGFPRDPFVEQFRPHWERERAEHPLDDLPWEGIGCWHPVFPARIDDVWLMAAGAVKFIEGSIDGTQPGEEVVVLE